MEQGIYFLMGFILASWITLNLTKRIEQKIGLQIIKSIQESVNDHIAVLEEVKDATGKTWYIDGGLTTAKSIAKIVDDYLEFYKDRDWEV